MIFTKVLMTIGEIFEKYGYPLVFRKVATSGTLLNYKIFGNCKQEGTPAPTNPVEIQTVGQKTANLWSGLNCENGYLANDGSIIKTSSNITSDYIEVEENTSYTAYMELSAEVQGNSIWFCFYDKDKNLLDNRDGMYMPATYAFDVLTPANTKYIRVSMGEDTKVLKRMVCKGIYTKDTIVYEPYGYKIPVRVNDAITTIYLDKPLYKAGNATDYLDFANNQVVRNVGIKTLNGSEADWDLDFYQDYFYTNDETFKDMSLDYATNSVICSNFECKSYETKADSTQDNYCFCAVNQYYATIGFMYKIIKTLDDWKSFLNTNPITVCYPLAAPVSEVVELPELAINEGLTVYTVDGLAPSNMYGKRSK